MQEENTDSNENGNVNDSVRRQISILKALSNTTESVENQKKFEIDEITRTSGLQDEKETQRFLFILEGQKLVSPYPVGDFTSRNWFITKDGLDALKSASKHELYQ